MNTIKTISGTFALIGGALLSASANAGSQFETGDTTPLTASAHLDFTIVVPKFVALRVGTGAITASNPTVDSLVFTVPADQIGNGTPVHAANSEITAQVLGNNGPIMLSATTPGAMNNGGGDVISYSQMDVAVAADTTATSLSHPVLVDGTSTSISLPTTSGRVTNLDGKWTFTYRNTNVVPGGTYGGVNTRNSRVTYSVSMP